MADLSFTTIEEPARAALRLTRDEYAACNYIATWGAHPENKRPGWCNRTKRQMSEFVGVTDRGLQKMMSRLERDGLVERLSEKTFEHRITVKWFNAVTLAKQDRRGEQSSGDGVNKVPFGGEQSSGDGVNKVPPHKDYSYNDSYNESSKADKPPKPEKKASEKKESPGVHRMVDIFEAQHKRHFSDANGSWIGFTWQAKEFGALKSLKSEFEKRLKGRGLDFSEDSVVESWKNFLQMAADSDRFTVNNWFTPTKLWSNFQAIIQKITQSNGKQQPANNHNQSRADKQRAALENLARDVVANGLR